MSIEANKFSKDIEIEGNKYGLKLNKNRCELLSTSINANIHFQDGVKVNKKPEVEYLGFQLNQYSNITQELSKRIAICMTVLKRLDIFWRHCVVTTAFKITVHDAVIRAKLLYGLESAQLTPSNQRRIETFQLKGLRKILRLTTTYVERANTNSEVFRKANEQLRTETREGKKAKTVKPFITCYKNARINNLVRLWKTNDDNPVKHITFQPNNENRIIPWEPPNRRVGRPRFKWVTETTGDIWKNIRHLHTHLPLEFDNKNVEQHDAIKETIMLEAHDPPHFCVSTRRKTTNSKIYKIRSITG